MAIAADSYAHMYVYEYEYAHRQYVFSFGMYAYIHTYLRTYVPTYTVCLIAMVADSSRCGSKQRVFVSLPCAAKVS